MPIEPSSVSSSTIREVEKPSQTFGSWTSMQGSSTGGKDSPANRIWEKAITGAQKLFGLDSSKSTPLDESNDSEEDSGKSTVQAYEHSTGRTSTLGNRNYGGYSGNAFGGDTFGSVVTSRAAAEPQQSMKENSGSFGGSAENERPDFVANDTGNEGIDSQGEKRSSKDRPLTDDRIDEEEVKEEKPLLGVALRATQTNLASVLRPVSQAEPSALQTPNKQVADQVNTVVPTPSPQDGQALATVPVVSNATTNLESSESVLPPQSTSKQIPTTATQISGSNLQASTSPQAAVTQQMPEQAIAKGQVQQLVEAGTKGQAQPVATEVAKPTVAIVQEVQVPTQSKVGSELSKQSETPTTAPQGSLTTNNQIDSQNRPASTGGEGLGFDLSKAKEAVSEALAKATTVASKVNVVQSQGVSLQSPTQVASPVESGDATIKPLGGESFASRPSLAGTTEGKEQSVVDGVKRDAASAIESRTVAAKSTGIENTVTARTSSAGSEGVALDAKTVQTAASTSAGANQFARETATAAAARMQAPVTQHSANGLTTAQQSGLSGVTATQGASVSTNGSQQGGAQNSSSGDSGAKKDLSEVLKQTVSGKGTEKLSSDSGQSFEAKVDEMTGRRTEAASKARQTSYVSKTAEEVKEVVATLTKSIDRLVTNKAGSMNLKINFEGGGSVNLRISMESGQVSTSMQTDVVGLEAAIKANWGELANDWNQKGVKLNTPQFQNTESGKPSSFDDFNDFASKQDRQAGGQSGDGRGRSAGGQASFNRGFSSSAGSENSEPVLSNAEVREKAVSNKELKTYA